MARRTKTSPFEDLVFIATRLPWWVSLLIALAAWLFFHSVATSPPPTITDPKQFASAMTGQMWRTFALFLQYIVPVAFIFGAIGSVFARAKRRKLIDDVASATRPDKTGKTITGRSLSSLWAKLFAARTFM